MIKQALGIALGVAAFYAIRRVLPSSVSQYIS